MVVVDPLKTFEQGLGRSIGLEVTIRIIKRPDLRRLTDENLLPFGCGEDCNAQRALDIRRLVKSGYLVRFAIKIGVLKDQNPVTFLAGWRLAPKAVAVVNRFTNPNATFVINRQGGWIDKKWLGCLKRRLKTGCHGKAF